MNNINTLRPDDEIDLRWYYTEASGDMGMRSSQGGCVAALEQMDHRHAHHPKPENPMHISKNSGARNNTAEDAMARLIDRKQPERLRRIDARLRAIAPCHRKTLEDHFTMSTDVPGTGVSPRLATEQPLAKQMMRELRLRKHRKGKDDMPTAMVWISNLIAEAAKSPEGANARLLGTIIGQARTALYEACEAYNGA